MVFGGLVSNSGLPWTVGGLPKIFIPERAYLAWEKLPVSQGGKNLKGKAKIRIF